MTEEKAYKISVGNRENKAMVGYLEMGQGNTISKGQLLPSQGIGGFIIFPNRTISWGRRLLKGKVPDRRIQATDVDYAGEIEWMKWGAEGGYPIIARLKHGCSTLDYDYQITQLQLPKFKEDDEDCYLQLPYGENSIFYDTEEVKAEFLRIHHENQDSISKSPNAEGGLYKEVKVFDTTKQEVKEMDAMFESVKIIKEANSFAKLKVLQSIVSSKRVIKHDISDEGSLYDLLILYAKESPDEFIGCVETYKQKVSEIFSKAESYNALDLTKDGDLVVLQPKKELLFSDIPAKGKNMIDWMFKNCLTPEVHEAINKLIHLSAKFK